MKAHYLKTIQPYFDEVKNGKKRFEFRKNDRDFEVGDEVYLQEYDPDRQYFSGKEVRATITYVLKNFKGIQKGYCVFSINVSQHISKPPYKLEVSEGKSKGANIHRRMRKRNLILANLPLIKKIFEDGKGRLVPTWNKNSIDQQQLVAIFRSSMPYSDSTTSQDIFYTIKMTAKEILTEKKYCNLFA